MQAVLMAAGKGKRLMPLTADTPKPMVNVGGTPILDWTFSVLPDAVEEVILVVGYRKEQIMDRYGDEWNSRRIRYVEQTELKGTGHAVSILEPLIGGKTLVLNGDDLYLKEDLERLCTHNLAVLGWRTDKAGRFGALATTDDGHLHGIVEGGEGSLVNVGAYVIDRRFFGYPLVPISDTEFGLPQTVAAIAQEHLTDIVEATAWLPIGFPEDIPKAEVWMTEYRNR